MRTLDSPLPLSAAGPGTAWFRLKLHSSLANKVEDIDANIESALTRDYIPFNKLIDEASGAVAVVGSGPSLKRNWRQLLDFKGDILACNAAFQFLLAKGITPKYMMCFDADPLALEFITPREGVTYLIASRCPPKVFDMLEGCRIVCWHAGGDEHIQELLEKAKRMEPMVIGGSAAVTRAMVLVAPMGYREIHLYGADSSHADGDTHIRKSTTEEGRMALMVAGRAFETSPWMAVQAEDFKTLMPIMTRLGLRVIVHGDGLIPHLAMQLGCETDLETSAQKFRREWRFKLRNVWNSL